MGGECGQEGGVNGRFHYGPKLSHEIREIRSLCINKVLGSLEQVIRVDTSSKVSQTFSFPNSHTDAQIHVMMISE